MWFAPPGWYPDPYDPSRSRRWWSGAQWTYHSAPSPHAEGMWRVSPPRRLPKSLVAVFVSSALIFWGVFAVEEYVGCGSVDPTDPNNYSSVVIRNDTANLVIVTDCRGSYCAYWDTALLRPRQTTRVDAACAASGSDMTSWRLLDTTGTTIGYIAVNTPRKHDGLVYEVSHASTHRGQPTTPDRNPASR